MKRLRIFFSLFFFLSFSASTFAAPPGVEKLIEWETRGNPAGVRDATPFKVKYYEIPVSEVMELASDALDPSVREALVFERDGKSYVRWLINPDDTEWHLKMAAYLKQKHLSAEIKTGELIGYRTASRSVIVENTANGAFFSAKLSTNAAGGIWKDKLQDASDSNWIAKVDAYVRQRTRRFPLSHVELLDEPLVFLVADEGISQGIVIRDISGLKNGEHYYLPGFSALDDKVGAEIAHLNGSQNPAKFWETNYAEALGRAQAEFYSRTGLILDSPHSQNFLIELDRHFKPTGRVVFRDYADADFDLKYLAHADEGAQKFASNFPDDLTDSKAPAAVDYFRGNNSALPVWAKPGMSEDWYKSHQKAFLKEVEMLAGVPLADVSAKVIDGYRHVNVGDRVKRQLAQRWSNQGPAEELPLKIVFSEPELPARVTPPPKTPVVVTARPKPQSITDAFFSSDLHFEDTILDHLGRPLKVRTVYGNSRGWGQLFEVVTVDGERLELIVANEGERLLDRLAESDKYRAAINADIPVTHAKFIGTHAYLREKNMATDAYNFMRHFRPYKDSLKMASELEDFIKKMPPGLIDVSKIDLTNLVYDKKQGWHFSSLFEFDGAALTGKSMKNIHTKLAEIVPAFKVPCAPAGTLDAALGAILAIP